MSKSADAFGIRPPEEVLAGAEDSFGRFDQPVVDEYPATKPAPKSGGMPLPAMIGIGVVGFLMVGALIAILARVLGGGGSAPPPKARTSMEAAQTAAEKLAVDELGAELASLKTTLAGLQENQQLLNARIEQVARSAQDVQSAERRIEGVEKSVSQVRSSIVTLDRKITDARPLDANLSVRDGVRVMSIGSGLARIIDKGEVERDLHKGDFWSGVRVLEIRADRGLVVLSDGSVIR